LTILVVADAEQPLPSVIVTLYVPAARPLSDAAVDPPGDHRYVAPDAVVLAAAVPLLLPQLASCS
jgi:hypothetical protein